MRKALLASVFGLFLMLGAASAQTVVRIGPPAAPREVVPVAPGPRYVWTGGFYRWNGRAYVWVPGRYVLPPRRHAVWVPGHWAPRRGGYVWVRGHWR